jgi:hypothetical protein
MKMFISILAAFMVAFIAAHAHASIGEIKLPVLSGIDSPNFEEEVQAAAYNALAPKPRFVFIEVPAPASFAADEQLQMPSQGR